MKITDIKEKQAKCIMTDARNKVKETKKSLKPLVSSSKYLEILKKVAETRTRVWNNTTTNHKSRMEFLISKHSKCCRFHQEESEWLKVRAGTLSTARDSTNPTTTSGSQPAGTTEKSFDQLISGTVITDEELDRLYDHIDKTKEKHEVCTFGEVELDNEERAILSKRPEFSIYDKVDKTRLAEEMNAALAKVRWDRINRDWIKDEDEIDAESRMSQEEFKERVLQEESARQEEAQSRLVYDCDSDVIDLGCRRSTDMKHSQMLHLPQARPPAEEATLSARLEVWKSTTSEFIEENCMTGGVLKTHNLSAEERIGLGKLKKRIRAGDITVLPSDKGNQFTVSSLES